MHYYLNEIFLTNVIKIINCQLLVYIFPKDGKIFNFSLQHAHYKLDEKPILSFFIKTPINFDKK